MSDDIAAPFLFPAVGRKKVTAAGLVASDVVVEIGDR